MPLLDTPEITQKLPHDCGAAAFHTLFRFHFPRKPVPDWGELADPVRGLGPDALELFTRKEFRNVAVGHFDLSLLRTFVSFTPVLVIVTVGTAEDHWLCVRGVTPTRVYVQDPDPAHPRRHYTHQEFLAVWRDCTAGGVYERFALTGWK